MFDLLLKNGTVVDGTGAAAYQADIAIKDGLIAQIAPDICEESVKTVDVSGFQVTPGFINNHSHSDKNVLFNSSGFNKIEQGITTECAGMCGSNVVPVHEGTFLRTRGTVSDELLDAATEICGDYRSYIKFIEDNELPINMAFYAGHGAIRGKVMGYSPEKPNAEQMEQMKQYVRDAMECGYLGLTTGLIYPPSVYADTEELIELSKVVAEYGGLYCSHIRGEGDTVVEATAEAIEIGEKSGCDVLISHMKVTGKNNLGKSKITTGLIEAARERGMRVFADQYPFTGCATGLISALPPKFCVDGPGALLKRLEDPEFRKECTEYISGKRYYSGEKFIGDATPAGCLITSSPYTPEYVGMTIQEVADQLQKDPYDVIYDVLIANKGSVSMVYMTLNEEDMMNIMSKPYVTAGTDASILLKRFGPEKKGGPHPRGISTFTKHLRLVRENQMFPMEQAIARVTGMAADIAGLDGIGYIREGYHADLCVIDYENIGETNDYIHPYRPNRGIEYVLISGKIVLEHGVANGVKAGRFVKKRKG